MVIIILVEYFKNYGKMVLVKSMFFKKSTSKYDFLLVGLGNPGSKYENTRHNAGFMVIDEFCRKYLSTLFRLKNKALVCETKVGDKRVLVAKPQTFMNLSGEAVSEICSYYKIPTQKIIVIFDDVSLDVGLLRIRRNGSHGGHNGMKNISEMLSTNDILRIKMGVGAKPHKDYDLADWVLSKFSKSEEENLKSGIEKAVSAVAEIITGSVDKAMNKYNS